MPRIMQPVALEMSVILTVSDAAAAIEFYKRAFAALERTRRQYPMSDAIEYAELAMGKSQLILRDERPDTSSSDESACKSPAHLGGSPVLLFVYFNDPDAAFDQAVSAGAKIVTPMSDGNLDTRSGIVRDPFGYQWMCASPPKNRAQEEQLKWPRIDIG